MLRVEIRTQHGLLGLEPTPPRLDMAVPRVEVDLETELPAVDIDIDYPTVEIDDREPRAEIGLGPNLSWARKRAAAARAEGLAGIARKSADGNALQAIEHGQRVVEVTVRRAWKDDHRQLNIDMAPKSRVRVEVHGGIEVSGNRGQVTVRNASNAFRAELNWGKVNTYLLQRPEIEIDVVGNRFSALG